MLRSDTCFDGLRKYVLRTCVCVCERAESREQRAESREQRAESREQRESRESRERAEREQREQRDEKLLTLINVVWLMLLHSRRVEFEKLLGVVPSYLFCGYKFVRLFFIPFHSSSGATNAHPCVRFLILFFSLVHLNYKTVLGVC